MATSGSFIALVKEYFPDTTDDEAMGILWNYTGYPTFWRDDPTSCCREQLQHLKNVGFEQADEEIDAAIALVTQGTESRPPKSDAAGSNPVEGTAA